MSTTRIEAGRDRNASSPSRLIPLDDSYMERRPPGRLNWSKEDERAYFYPYLARRICIVKTNPEHEERRRAALQLTKELIPTDHERSAEFFYPDTQDSPFLPLLKDLDDLLVGHTEAPPDENSLYTISGIGYRGFKARLGPLIDAHADKFRILQNISPYVPRWGVDDDPDVEYSEIDFELIALTYRYDVEKLLDELDFARKVRVTTSGAPIVTSGLPRTPHVARVVSPVILPSAPEVSLTKTRPVEDQTRKGYSTELDTPIQVYTTIPEDGFTSIRKKQAEILTAPSKEKGHNPAKTRPHKRMGGSQLWNEMFTSQWQKEGKDYTPHSTLRSSPAGSENSILRYRREEAPRRSRTPSVREDVPLGPQRPPLREGDRDPGGGDDDDGGDDDGPRGPLPPFGPPRRRPNPPGFPPPQAVHFPPVNQAFQLPPLHFDRKLKPEVIEEWDGDPDTLARWILSINIISAQSIVVHQQLGQIVPTRFRKRAKEWFYSLPNAFRLEAMQDWDTLRDVIGAYFMNRTWLDKQKARANRASYRESGHSHELPSDYFVRKSELIRLVYQMTETELIMEIMNGAPPFWRTIIDTQRLDNSVDLQHAIKYHEEALTNPPLESQDSYKALERRLRALEEPRRFNSPQAQKLPVRFRPKLLEAKTHLVGWSKSLGKPQWPKDDSIVSQGKTPEMLGVRPCRHCGSSKHWDFDCSHSRKGGRLVRSNFTTPDEEYLTAMAEYEEVYYATTDEEEVTEEELPQDFRKALHSEIPEHLTIGADTSGLGGLSRMKGEDSAREVAAHSVRTWIPSETPIITRKERRAWSKKKKSSNSYATHHAMKGQPIYLSKLSARPPGCSFLGSKATSTEARFGGSMGIKDKIIIDSGSDITLISHKFLSKLSPTPKIRTGQRINLVQVTGATVISGYITTTLQFDTPTGPVILSVEAYVVKGMNIPFILGNDFADQYRLSIVRKEEGTYLSFGETDRQVRVENSIIPNLENEHGQAFRVELRSQASALRRKMRLHRNSNKKKNRKRLRARDDSIRVATKVFLPPYTVTSVPVTGNFREEPHVFVEGGIIHKTLPDLYYGAPDSLIPRSNPLLQVANFSSQGLQLTPGTLIGRIRYPTKGEHLSPLRSNTKRTDPVTESTTAVSTPLDLSTNSPPALEDPPGSDPVLGGPKTAESPDPESYSSSDLLDYVELGPDLSSVQREQLGRVISSNSSAFGLDGRLGHLQVQVEINLREGTKELSLPPFQASPAKRQVIDQQLDEWLNKGVVEPSKSPWGFPVIIVYRNQKPRFCVDYRKLNALTIPDAFSLPRQEDILQALTGSQWLSTLDALSGFTQLEIREEDREKTAFRTHRGLHQFRRMPFGLRNGPSVFQRVMQNILSPYLWLFALVYIDDIVIYSSTFEDHLLHVDQVLKTIAQSGLTLSPPKCHFGFQSLLLLGQKVSRLGMSTHKEKVDAILELDNPRSVSELQTFLGMMVYFSAYVPFYAWIVAPLFRLLKKGVEWHWGTAQEEAFRLAKEVLVNAPVRAFAIPGLGYRLYSDASEVGVASILQQIQPIRVRDLKGTKTYEKLQTAYQKGEPVPNLVLSIGPAEEKHRDQPAWNAEFDETLVNVERVIAYWSRTLKAAERNYSPTEREALALKEGLVKFQAYIEGEKVLAITDHAALQWTRTFQNVNRRLLSWGTVFAAYPDLTIVHRAGRVHSNVDPISRLRRRVPIQAGPSTDLTQPTPLELGDKEPLKNLYEEMLPNFESKVLRLSSYLEEERSNCDSKVPLALPLTEECLTITYNPSHCFSLLIDISPEEIRKYSTAYDTDPHYRLVEESLKKDQDWNGVIFPQYFRGEDNLIYFEDALGRNRLCVPRSLIQEVMSENHDVISEGAHAGFHKTYNRISAVYYWPRMSKDIKKFVFSCDLCQKSKPKRHAPVGLLQPIPIPTQPFEVVSMDFIPELPLSKGYDSILVIVDKLTKYRLFIPTTTTITDKGTAQLFFEHVVAHYGLPRQIIMDRDPVWANTFWKELTKRMEIRRALSTAHHPQTDGQTEVLNQTLEIALRSYVNEAKDNWCDKLSPLMLSYNSSVHSSSGYSPSFLLRGYEPLTGSKLLPRSHSDAIKRNLDNNSADRQSSITENDAASSFTDEFLSLRSMAKDALALSQAFQRKAYNKGRLIREFEEGDLVLINVNSLKLSQETKGRGSKLQMKYDGPFEIIEKLSSVAYRLRMPASYKIHPVLNIIHLEPYKASPPELGTRATRRLGRSNFDELEEYEVEAILDEKSVRGRNGRRNKLFWVKFVGYETDYNEWLSRSQLKNAPEILRNWETRGRVKNKPGDSTAIIPRL